MGEWRKEGRKGEGRKEVRVRGGRERREMGEGKEGEGGYKGKGEGVVSDSCFDKLGVVCGLLLSST